MGGFAALLGGMAEPAQSYAHDVRNQHLQIWGTHQKNLMDMLDKSYEVAGTPEARAGILATRGKVAKLKPGDDPSKLLEEANAWLMPHPTVVQALTPGEPQKQPGPAQPGQTPGTPQIAPIAAQPSGSPVQPGSQPQQPQAQGGPMAEMLSTPLKQRVMQQYEMFVRAGQNPPPQLEQAAQVYMREDAELERIKGAYEAQLASKKKGYGELESSGDLDNLLPYQKAGYHAESLGLPPINTPGYALRSRDRSIDADSMSPTEKTYYGLRPDARGKWTAAVDFQGKPTGEVVPGWAGTGVLYDQKGQAFQYDKNNPQTSAPVGTPESRGTSTGFSNPRLLTLPNFKQVFQSPNQAAAGTYTPTQGVNVAGSPTVTESVEQVPGQLPKSTKTTKSRVGASPATTPRASIPPVGGGAGPISPVLSGNDAIIAQKYNDWVEGKATPVGRELTAVQAYAAQHKLGTPDTLTATGQRDLKDIDEVLGQIKQLKTLMESRKMHTDDSLGYYPEFFKYSHGSTSTPNQDLWTGLSFEGLRSAAAALKGTNSRALPIISRALEHVPRPSANLSVTNPGSSHLPDSPKKMYGKLSEMVQILTQGRENIMRDMKKGGVIPPVKATPAGPEEWERGPDGVLRKK